MVEGFEEVLWDELTEPLLQSQKLGFNSTHKPPVHIKSEMNKIKKKKVNVWRTFASNVYTLYPTQSLEYYCGVIYLTYSFLFSSVTGTLRPLGLSSCCENFPKALCSTQNV